MRPSGNLLLRRLHPAPPCVSSLFFPPLTCLSSAGTCCTRGPCLGRVCSPNLAVLSSSSCPPGSGFCHTIKSSTLVTVSISFPDSNFFLLLSFVPVLMFLYVLLSVYFSILGLWEQANIDGVFTMLTHSFLCVIAHVPEIS